MLQMMTPTLDQGNGSGMQQTVAENTQLRVMRDDFCERVQQRTAQGPAGYELNNAFNSTETKDITVTCACEPHECLIIGSIRVVAKAKVMHTTAMNPWSLEGDNALVLPAEQNSVFIPSGMIHAQFQSVDATFGHSPVSLKALMPFMRQNQHGSHALFQWAYNYFNQPYRKGHPRKGYSDSVSRAEYHGGRHMAVSSETNLEFIEALAHPLNVNTQTLITQSFSETDSLKMLPPGMSPRFKFTFAHFLQRVVLIANPQLVIRFDSVQVFYTVASMPQLIIPSPLTYYPVMDLHCEAFPLTQGQRQAYIPITRGDQDLIPQVLVAFVAHKDAFIPERLTRWGPELGARAMDSFSISFRGSNVPFFHQHTVDGKLRFDNHDEVNTMRAAFLGKAGRQAMATPEHQLSTADYHLLEEEFENNQKQVHKCVLMLTDPNTQLSRDSCGGVSDGRFDITVDFAENTVNGLDRLYVLKFIRYDVVFNSPGNPQANELSPGHCKPSYADTMVPSA